MVAEPEQPMGPPIEPPQDVLPMEESIEAFGPPTAPKERLSGAIGKARETIIGSGSLKEEISGLGRAYLDVSKQMIVTPPKALWELVRLHPINAARETARGFGDVLGSTVKMATSPSRLAVAGAGKVAKAAKKTAKMPFKLAAGIAKSPFRVWNMLDKGTDKLFKHL